MTQHRGTTQVSEPERLRMAFRRTRQRIPLALIGKSAAMHTLRNHLAAFAPFETPLVIVGEPGTGTHEIAEFVHSRSPQRGRVLLVRDTSAISEARFVREGLCGDLGDPARWLYEEHEAKQGGTLVLAHVEQWPTWVLHRLLWELDHRTMNRAQRPNGRHVGLRILVVLEGRGDWREGMASGHRRLMDRLSCGEPLLVPPLRERCGDIALVAQAALREANGLCGTRVRRFSPGAKALLHGYQWPGNIEEVRAAVVYAVQRAEEEVRPEHLPDWLHPSWTGGERGR